MRILYVFRSLAVWGGIERVLVEKMNYLSSVYGYDVYMITSDQGSHPIPYHLEDTVHIEDLNIRFYQQYQFNIVKRRWVARQLKNMYEQRLVERIRQIQPDIIVCTTADHIDSLAKLKGSIPLVVESHSICLRTIEDGRCWLQRKWYKYHYLKALSNAEVIVALTEGDAVDWRKFHRHVKVIPNMLHPSDKKPSSLASKRVIWVGRFDYQKRAEVAITIWNLVVQKHPDWCLDIYGEGEMSPEIELMASKLKNINVHKPTARIFDCYRESSILMSTSLFEPFGLVLVEAMSCGLPVVSYDCPYGPSHIISNGVDGFIVPFDNKEYYADKISILMDNCSLRERMGQAAFASSKRFDAEHIMPQWAVLFDELSKKW